MAAAVAAILVLASSASATYSGANGKIAFLGDSLDIFSVNLDRTGLRNLTPNVAINRAPVRWSPDGSKLAFISDGDGLDNFYDLYKMNADGSGLIKLSSTGGVGSFDWSPDSSMIAFASGNLSIPWSLWRVNADGSGQTHIGDPRDTSYPIYSAPVWAPDGTKIAAVKAVDGANSEIVTMSPDGTVETRLTNTAYRERDPVWSPDSSKIAVTTNRETGCEAAADGCYTIYVMNADGGEQRRLTNHTATDAVPQWSPDGSRIAFLSLHDDPHAYEIYTANVDGTDVRRITFNTGDDSFHTWSPDSSKLAFLRRGAGSGDKIYVINADGSGERFLIDGFQPDWQRLVRSSFRNASEFCKAQRASSGRAAFRQRYRTFGHCIRQSRDS